MTNTKHRVTSVLVTMLMVVALFAGLGLSLPVKAAAQSTLGPYELRVKNVANGSEFWVRYNADGVDQEHTGVNSDAGLSDIAPSAGAITITPQTGVNLAEIHAGAGLDITINVGAGNRISVNDLNIAGGLTLSSGTIRAQDVTAGGQVVLSQATELEVTGYLLASSATVNDGAKLVLHNATLDAQLQGQGTLQAFDESELLQASPTFTGSIDIGGGVSNGASLSISTTDDWTLAGTVTGVSDAVLGQQGTGTLTIPDSALSAYNGTVGVLSGTLAVSLTNGAPVSLPCHFTTSSGTTLTVTGGPGCNTSFIGSLVSFGNLNIAADGDSELAFSAECRAEANGSLSISVGEGGTLRTNIVNAYSNSELMLMGGAGSDLKLNGATTVLGGGVLTINDGGGKTYLSGGVTVNANSSLALLTGQTQATGSVVLDGLLDVRCGEGAQVFINGGLYGIGTLQKRGDGFIGIDFTEAHRADEPFGGSLVLGGGNMELDITDSSPVAVTLKDDIAEDNPSFGSRVLTKTGTGALAPQDATSFTGPLFVAEGTLQLAGQGTMPGMLGTVTVFDGALLDVAKGTWNINTLLEAQKGSTLRFTQGAKLEMTETGSAEIGDALMQLNGYALGTHTLIAGKASLMSGTLDSLWGNTMLKDCASAYGHYGLASLHVTLDAPPNDPPAQTGTAGSPQTGDNTNLPLWALCGGVALLGMILLIRRRATQR